MSMKSTAMNLTSTVVPPHWQIRAVHRFVKMKNRIFKGPFIPTFVETPIPDVNTLPLEEIDVSNPFLFRQNKWQSYFKRLRDE
ncbi:MAG TPA: cytochrome P450, partial [Alcanivorax sp.]|nr:cytochrome P450 [Alcanivorax sp.]